MEIRAIGCEPLQLKRMHLKDPHTLKVYQETAVTRVAEKGDEYDAGRNYQRSQSVWLARARRRGFSDRNEMVVRAEKFAEAEIRRLQRRRIEPGTFKDRYLLERDPHALIEGMLIAAFALGSQACYIYYARRISLFDRHYGRAIEEARAAGISSAKTFWVRIFRAKFTRTPARALISAARKPRFCRAWKAIADTRE
jgi:hypothetical protein